MKSNRTNGAAPAVTAGRAWSGGTVAAAVLAILHGNLPQARADVAESGAKLEEIVVTATRRQQALEAVPYSISAISPEQLAASGATDVASLSAAVPGLSMYDYGARFAGATAPIIRGINATGSPARGFRTFEQDPVGTYIGNSPIDGYFQLDDLRRIEVLRGPQGTLYGAGALGGALRLIPNSPDLSGFSGELESSGSRTAHSGGTGYTVRGLVNAPLSDTVAFRASAKYAYEPGWIKVFGILKRSSDDLYGTPVPADPNDIIDSPPIYGTQSDWNDQKTFSGRASLLWKPSEVFNIELAFMSAHVTGNGGPQVNLDYKGGVSPIDPQQIYPAGGPYQELALVQEPFRRSTSLVSLDASYDAGFATLSSTTSYHETDGSLIQDSTFNYTGFAGGYYLPYYAGVPTNPRFIYPFQFTDSAHDFSEELRLVSKTSADARFDYVLGLFYAKQTRHGAWLVTNPGSPERSVAQGCTNYYYYSTTPLPPSYCLLLSGPDDVTFQQIDTQTFEDKSVFGELSWHPSAHGQVTFGMRHFSQSFTDRQLYQDYTFNVLVPPIPWSSPASRTVGKVNPSYEFADHQYVYALWSEGFRRGGANSVPATGIFQESPLLRTYAPDQTNNYEIGIKGRFNSGHSYSIAVFDVRWDKPQISSSLPSGNLAVYNANKAESKGFEFESSGPLGLPSLSYSVSFAYADAKLTSDFSLPANDGYGNIVPGLLSGKSGQQLPGSPKTSVSLALLYDMKLAAGYELTLSANGVYRDKVALQVAPSLSLTTVQYSSTYEVLNLSAALKQGPWLATLYATNALDRQAILGQPSQPNQLNDLTNDYLVSPPREIGLRLRYAF
ncbi:MAG TPA: TonB-dependent receptor [Steroidobacteraceae bacterium]|nr:TonB-dependent receptor [Steroidobacteraceae bacterium]